MPDPISNGVTIRPATPADLPLTARWQCRFLPDGLFPRLGTGFVRHWHATFLSSPHGLAFVAETAGPAGPVPAGFLFGSSDQLRHVEDVLRRHRLRLGLQGAVALAARPRLCRDFIRTRRRAYLRRLLKRPAPGRATKTGAAPVTAPPIAVITAVVVDPAARGRGVGEQLVEQFLAQASGAGAPLAELVTQAGPGGAGRFYERLGWRPVHEHTTRDGTTVRTYRFDLVGETPG